MSYPYKRLKFSEQDLIILRARTFRQAFEGIGVARLYADVTEASAKRLARFYPRHVWPLTKHGRIPMVWLYWRDDVHDNAVSN